MHKDMMGVSKMMGIIDKYPFKSKNIPVLGPNYYMSNVKYRYETMTDVNGVIFNTVVV